jgi:myo-inositol-1(or 4)-monophosphatase
MDDTLDFTINLAKEAGDLIQGFYSSSGIHAFSKPDQTVVTEADLAADLLISRSIETHFPFDEIISEESVHFLKDSQSPTWVVDPLDGTTNFSLGLAVWGVSIARLINGYPILGVLYFPQLNELYTTQRGSGAYLNNHPIYVREPNSTENMSFFACCSRSYRTFNINIPYKPRILGSSAYSFCMVARGTALLGLDASPKIWDLAAAWLLVEEAGGLIKPFKPGQVFPISTGIDYSTTSWSVLAAASPKLFEMGYKKIQKK